MKKLIFLGLLLTSSFGFAEPTKTIFNPFTGKLDYITKMSSSTLPSGSTQYIQNTLSPTTATQKFSVERGTFTDNTTTPKINFTAKTGMMIYPDGTSILAMPDAFTTYFGYTTYAIAGTNTFDTSYGSNAMPYPGAGAFNTCVGAFCMSGNVITSAENNNSMGYASCGALRAGFYNNCMGGSSGNVLRDGTGNTFMGAYSGQRITDSGGNTHIGFQAGSFQTGGNFNTNVGYDAGNGTTTVNANALGGTNTNIGKSTGQGVLASVVINNSIAIGNGALYTDSNKAQIGGQPGTGMEVEMFVSSFTANNGWIQLAPRTIAVLRSMTPTAVGQSYYCSDCTNFQVCTSSGTGVGAYASPISRTTTCLN